MEEQIQGKDLLRFTTAGSVDDGKSTLIGRLLHDTHGAFEDQIQAAIKHNENKGRIGIDLALLTDGLRAEREQGITIDVAYRYFATSKRKFIIADTPGHEQYTRNMVTGASTADAAIVLIDARHGLVAQSKRHTIIATLLGIQEIIIAVNKMDLVNYAEETFLAIQKQFAAFLDYKTEREYSFHFIPMSALVGDMVVGRLDNMPWYHGETLLEKLETIEVNKHQVNFPFRFAVQRVSRPQTSDLPDFRGYMGEVISGTIKVGDRIQVLPGGQEAEVKEIVTGDMLMGEPALSSAQTGDAVNLVLSENLDISRGHLFVHPATRRQKAFPIEPVQRIEANICWMAERPLAEGDSVLLQHTTNVVKAVVKRIDSKMNLNNMAERTKAEQLHLNDIGIVSFRLQQPIMPDLYKHNRVTGAFILIDSFTHGTVGAGMISDC